MERISSFNLHQAGLLFRNAANLLCCTTLTVFDWEQTVYLERRLKLALDALPGVELELGRLGQAEWQRLRDDIEALLDACRRFRESPPAEGYCDHVERLYLRKARVHEDIWSLKDFISRAFEAESAAASQREARLVELRRQLWLQLVREIVARGQEREELAAAHAELLEAASDLPRVGGMAADVEVQENANHTEAAQEETPEVSTQNASGSQKKKAGKKKKTTVKLGVLREYPRYECTQEEEADMADLKLLFQRMDADYDPQHAHEVLTLSESFDSIASLSPALLAQRSQTLYLVASVLVADGDVEGMGRALEKAMASIRALLVQQPKDDFARQLLVDCNYKAVHELHFDDPDKKILIGEGVQSARRLHPHRHHYAPLFEQTPEFFTYLLAYFLGSYASLSSAHDPALAEALYVELICLPAPLPSPHPRDSQTHQECVYFRAIALDVIADLQVKRKQFKQAIASVESGMALLPLMEEPIKESAGWQGVLQTKGVQACLGEEKRLLKLQALNETMTRARKSQGRLESDKAKAKLAEIRTELEGVRASLERFRRVI